MPAQGRRRRRPYAPRMPTEERRQQLLDAALRVVADQGHHQVTMDTVAEQAGVTKPVVYSVFSSRSALLGALLEREQAGAVAQVIAALHAAHVDLARTPPDELFAGITQAYLDGVVAAPYRWRCILFAVEGAPAELRAAIDESRELLRRVLADLLTSVVERQGAAPAVDVDVTSHALVALAEMAGRLLLKEPENYTVDRMVRSSTPLLRLLQP